MEWQSPHLKKGFGLGDNANTIVKHLMRSIANNEVHEIPGTSQVCTVFVLANIQGEQVYTYLVLSMFLMVRTSRPMDVPRKRSGRLLPL